MGGGGGGGGVEAKKQQQKSKKTFCRIENILAENPDFLNIFCPRRRS